MTEPDDDRKNFRRKKLTQKEDKKKIQGPYDDFSYSKIKNQFKKRKASLQEQDLLDEMEDYS